MAYLILAHEDERQLDALLGVLVPPGSPDVAIIHADRRSALCSSLKHRDFGANRRVIIVDDAVAVRWGHASQVVATIKLVRVAATLGCDYAHLISGADWPIIAPAEIAAQIAATGDRLCYIDVRPDHLEGRMQTFRFDTRWLRLDPARDKAAYAAAWELRRAARWLDAARTHLRLARSRPWGHWCYGSQWWSLPADAIALLADELPKLIASGRLAGTICSDEHVIPTLINHSFAGRIAANHRFIDFAPRSSSPRILGSEDAPAIAASGAWFMRKVSAKHSPFFRQFPLMKAGAAMIGETTPMC